MNEPLEMSEIRRDGVCNTALEIAPDEFVRVELGSVAWEAMKLQAGSRAQEFAHKNAAMLVDVVPDDEYGAAQTLEE